jgi:hypothetical protein
MPVMTQYILVLCYVLSIALLGESKRDEQHYGIVIDLRVRCQGEENRKIETESEYITNVAVRLRLKVSIACNTKKVERTVLILLILFFSKLSSRS